MIQVDTPCRLHFGLLAYNREESRQFGGAGLMVAEPRISVRVAPADAFRVTGPMAERAGAFAQTFAAKWAARQAASGRGNRGSLHGAEIHITDAPRPHTGLGSGTHLGMVIARARAELADPKEATTLGVDELAGLVSRGARSAIGAYGFFHGGFIIEGGKRDPLSLSPMLVQQPFPPHWRLVLITPDKLVGLSADREVQAFAKMISIPREVTAEMCRLTLLGLLPALIERDLSTFSAALYDMQQRVGMCFAAAQGGIYADPLLERIVKFIRAQGVEGVGQSSWGPTLYAVTESERSAQELATRVRDEFELAQREVLVTAADNAGCKVSGAEVKSVEAKSDQKDRVRSPLPPGEG